VKVVHHGGAAQVTLPVIQAAPALFAMDGTGGGQGAILNNDGSVNSYDNPAQRGSVVSLFGTGLGQTIPVSEDGMINDSLTLPAAVLPVTALIDGQPAEILYAGAAPGMLHGFVQVNVRIPAALISTGDVRVTLKAGDYSSPTIITLNVK
jgi:uncharacterized protein (TIGR03437 family)